MMRPEDIVTKMMGKDEFSRWLGIEVQKIEEGYCKLKMKISSQMVNGFDITHGGITYSLSDSALAFASNSYGKQCVSIETSISHVRPVKTGDTITAICTELNRGRTLGNYQVTITNQENKKVAFFKGTVYISDVEWK